MSVKWESVKAGEVLFDCKVRKAWPGYEWATWPVEIVEIDHASNSAIVKWNHNLAQRWTRRSVEKLRRKRPVAKRV